MNYFLIYIAISYCYGALRTKFIYRDKEEIANSAKDNSIFDNRKVLNFVIPLVFVLSPIFFPLMLLNNIIDLIKRDK